MIINYRKSFLLVIMFLLILLSSCKPDIDDSFDGNYREEMRYFVQGISEFAKDVNPDFIIIPQNGHQLMTKNGESDGELAIDYLNAIDGVGREDLFYGYEEDNQLTNEVDHNEMLAFMDLAENFGIEVLVTDYCYTQSYMGDSYFKNNEKDYLSFAADSRLLNNIPTYPITPYNENDNDIKTLSDAKNFLYIINPELFSTKISFLEAIKNTNYDLVIIDLFFIDDLAFTVEDIELLKTKSNGAERLVIAYMSIGEAEDYRYYWETEWNNNYPSWIASENPEWEGNYKVKYWDIEWQNLIYGNNDSYLKLILDAHFDGVYLDIIDGFEYFEE